MKKIMWIALPLFCLLLSSCSNLPQNPTLTPTYSQEELQQFAEQTAEAAVYLTQTQDAIDNPSPTPLPTDTPLPPATATSDVPVIPPTATEAPRPYYSMGTKSRLVYQVGAPNAGTNSFVPSANLYIEVCYQNNGSGTWNSNFRCAVTNQKNSIINPKEMYLGKDVGPGQTACFSFNNYHAEAALGAASASFYLYTDTGQQLVNGDNYASWTIY